MAATSSTSAYYEIREIHKGRKHMNISSQIRNHRKRIGLSQEELAEKIYVSRQTISNWETGRSYPDVHNLLLLSALYEISIDELIKGDVEIMKEKISSRELQNLSRMMILFFALMILTLPLVKKFSDYFFILTLVSGALMMFYAVKIERMKKELDIRTYREIVDFMEGKPVERTIDDRKKKLFKENILKVVFGMGVGGALAFLLLALF
ncbi:MAG TPA: transcriptional regulator [Clostridiaceae bacterium]|nr:transcriptional regulator [Clostridiaceae bacterium]